MCNNNLYSRFEGTYRNLCDSIDRLDDSDFPYKEIARGDLGCDLAYLRELINEVRSLERKNRELQAVIDRCIGHGGVWAREIIRQTRKEKDALKEPKFKCFYLCGGKLSWSDHDTHIKTMVKFIKNNESWVTEQFYDCLCYAVRCLDFAQQWKNEFQEMPWIYYGMEHLVGVRDIIYEFYSFVKYNINERLKDSLIDAIACIEWFCVNLKNSPRNERYKDFHEYDDFVLKRNPKYIQGLHCMFLRQARKEEERLIRKAEENRKNSNTSNALLKPVNSEEKPKAKKHYNDFGEYLDDHPEIVKMAEKYPTMFQERVYEYRMPLKEKLIWIALYTVGIVSAVFVGGVIGSLIKEFL